MAKTKLEKLATVLTKATASDLHGYGIMFAGGWSKKYSTCPDTAGEKQRPDSDCLAAVIVELDSRNSTKRVKGKLLQAQLMQNLRTFTTQANNAIKRAKAEKEKQAKAKTA